LATPTGRGRRVSLRLEHSVDLPLAHQRGVAPPGGGPVGELRQPADCACEHRALLDRSFEALLPDRNVEAGLAQRVLQRPEGVPVKRLRRHRRSVLVEVAGRRRAAEPLPELAQKPHELVRTREAAWHEARSALRLVPAPEVLDNGLRVDRAAGILLELPHRRRALEPLCAAGELREDLLVRVAPANSRLELGQRLPVDARERAERGRFPGHGNNNRAHWPECKLALSC